MPRKEPMLIPQAALKKADEAYDAGRYADCLSLIKEVEVNTSFADLSHKQLSELYNLAGLSCYAKGLLIEAEQYLLKSLAYAQKNGEANLIYIRYENLASIVGLQQRYRVAIEYLQKAIDLKENGGFYKDVGRSLLQLSSFYSSLEDFESVGTTLSKAKNYLEQYEQHRYMPHWNFAYATYLEKTGKFKQALSYHKLASDLSEKNNEWLILSRINSNIGSIYFKLKNWKRAEVAYNKSLQIATKHQLKADEVHCLVSLSEISLNKGNYKLARQLMSRIEKDLPVFGNELIKRHALQVQAELYEAEKNYPKALEYQRKYTEAHRQYYSTELNKAILDLQARYENEKKERELQQAKLQRTESELKALRAQMNPHFIFNALSGIRKAFFEGNLAVADKYMVRFSRLLRLILDSTRTPLMRLSENIEMLELYMQIEQARQNNGFTYTIELPKTFAAETIYVPGMLLQPIVENSIVHGLFAKSDGKGKLTVTFSKAGNKLKVAVTDNGVGRSAATDNAKAGHVSHATSIIKETLALAWKEADGSKYIKITDRVSPKGKPAGTRVEVTIPANLKP